MNIISKFPYFKITLSLTTQKSLEYCNAYLHDPVSLNFKLNLTLLSNKDIELCSARKKVQVQLVLLKKDSIVSFQCIYIHVTMTAKDFE